SSHCSPGSSWPSPQRGAALVAGSLVAVLVVLVSVVVAGSRGLYEPVRQAGQTSSEADRRSAAGAAGALVSGSADIESGGSGKVLETVEVKGCAARDGV